MDCVAIPLRRSVSRFVLAATAALLLTPAQAERTTPVGAPPAAAKVNATEAAIVNGKVVLKAAKRAAASRTGDEETAPEAEATREWLVEETSNSDRSYPPRPLPVNLLMCRPGTSGS